MEKIVSKYNHALAYQDIRESENDLIENDHFDLLPLQYLSLSNASTDLQANFKVVKVSGNITVSF